jgi:hypothetical protein
MGRWILDHPELALVAIALAGNAVAELLEKLGAKRAAGVVAALVPHVRSLVAVFVAAKTHSAIAADSESRPLALDSQSPGEANSEEPKP